MNTIFMIILDRKDTFKKYYRAATPVMVLTRVLKTLSRVSDDETCKVKVYEDKLVYVIVEYE